MIRAYSFRAAINDGLEPRDYKYDDIPTGEYCGILDFKIWAKKGPGLHCYFTLDNGNKIKVTAFKNRGSDSNAYTARDGFFDLSQKGLEGTRFTLNIGVNSKGRTAFLSAQKEN